jgi:hypothetical protein
MATRAVGVALTGREHVYVNAVSGAAAVEAFVLMWAVFKKNQEK